MQLPDFLTRDDDGFIHITGSRVGLQHLVHYYNEGYSVEMLAADYPPLSLAVIHKVIGFYLDNRAAADGYLAGCRAELERQRAATPPVATMAELRRRFEAMRLPVNA